LFVDGLSEGIEAILCQSLQDKFVNDMDLDNPMMSPKEMVEQVEDFVRAEIRARSYHKNEIFFTQDTYPYAVTFILFMCGKHKIALDFCKKYCCHEFSSMYQDYIFKYECKGFPDIESHRYQEAMQRGDL
jgi:hypothetical protein